MRVNAIGSAGAPALSPPQSAKDGFADFLRENIAHLAKLQSAADRAAEAVAAGDLAHLQEAVIAMQEASLALDFVVAVRSHVLEGIQELLRTQA